MSNYYQPQSQRAGLDSAREVVAPSGRAGGVAVFASVSACRRDREDMARAPDTTTSPEFHNRREGAAKPPPTDPQRAKRAEGLC